MHHKGGAVHVATGVYREIDEPRKLVFTWHWERDENHESLVTISFRELGPSSTELTLTHENLPSTEERDKHQYGWNGCLAQLAKLLTTESRQCAICGLEIPVCTKCFAATRPPSGSGNLTKVRNKGAAPCQS